jgi:hypothetical protein
MGISVTIIMEHMIIDSKVGSCHVQLNCYNVETKDGRQKQIQVCALQGGLLQQKQNKLSLWKIHDVSFQ